MSNSLYLGLKKVWAYNFCCRLFENLSTTEHLSVWIFKGILQFLAGKRSKNVQEIIHHKVENRKRIHKLFSNEL